MTNQQNTPDGNKEEWEKEFDNLLRNAINPRIPSLDKLAMTLGLTDYLVSLIKEEKR